MAMDTLTYTGTSSSYGPLEEPAEKWQAPMSARLGGAPAVTADRVVALTSAGGVDVFDRTTGSACWNAYIGGQTFGSPRVHGETIYVASSHRAVYALDLATGQERWTAQVGGWVHGHLTVTDEQVLVSSGDGKLQALDRATGEARWRTSISGKESLGASVADGEVYAAGGKKVHALSLDKGRKSRSGTLTGIVSVRTTPMVAGDALVVGTLSKGFTGAVIALDRNTLAERWRVPMEGQVTGALAVSDGIVLAAGERGPMRGIDLASGAVRWELPDCSAELHQSMTIARGIAYLGTRWTGVHAVDVASGTRRWSVMLLGEARSPTVADGTLFVGSSGTLYALE